VARERDARQEYLPSGLDIQGLIEFDFTVNQAGRDIVVDNNSNGTTFSGELEDDDSGFVAVGSTIRTGSGASACTATPGLSFRDLNDDRADVLFLLLLDCASGIGCELGYTGQAIEVSGRSPGPTPARTRPSTRLVPRTTACKRSSSVPSSLATVVPGRQLLHC
jgi:hypothetical protein